MNTRRIDCGSEWCFYLIWQFVWWTTVRTLGTLEMPRRQECFIWVCVWSKGGLKINFLSGSNNRFVRTSLFDRVAQWLIHTFDNWGSKNNLLWCLLEPGRLYPLVLFSCTRCVMVEMSSLVYIIVIITQLKLVSCLLRNFVCFVSCCLTPESFWWCILIFRLKEELWET